MRLAGTNVLVTGGAGFIGSEVVRQLAAAGAHISVVDNLTNGKRTNLAGLPANLVQLHVADIRDQDTLERLLADVAIVFHLACLGVRHSIHSPLENHEINAYGTLETLLAARACGVQRFVHVSSSEVYGTALHTPMTEDHPTFPMTVYGAAKLAGECYARAFHRTYGFPTVIVRPFNTYGPRCHHEGDSGEVIPKFLLRCLAGRPLIVFGDGRQTRDFTYVSDTARGIIAAGLCDAAIGQTLNLGSGCETSVNELASETMRAAGASGTVVERDAPRPGDVARLCADTQRARVLLGFQPEVGLRTGLAYLLAWYQSLGQSWEDLLRQETVHNWAPKLVDSRAGRTGLVDAVCS
jgi:UDP-glucose 4-epimerase